MLSSLRESFPASRATQAAPAARRGALGRPAARPIVRARQRAARRPSFDRSFLRFYEEAERDRSKPTTYSAACCPHRRKRPQRPIETDRNRHRSAGFDSRRLHTFSSFLRDVSALIGFASQAALDEHDRLFGRTRQAAETSQLYLLRPNREPTQYIAAVNELLRAIPMPTDGLDARWRTEIVKLPGAAIRYGEGPTFAINDITFKFFQTTLRTQFTVESTKLVELILTPIGEDTDFLIYADDLARFTIDPATGAVVSRA